MPGDTKPRIFLSYGHRDAPELVLKIREDLLAHGYDVWQDAERIRKAHSWDEEIEIGLKSSKAVVAFLGPHAIRRANDPANPDGVDSVCLDEINWARFTVKIPIVPVLALPCEAPLEICRLQWIDLHRWRESEAVYHAGLKELTGALAEVLSGKPARERTWAGLPAPWDFEPFLNDKRRDFTGREWLFGELERWCIREPGPALLILGDPGIGKSAIVAQLVHADPSGRVLAYHCCQADTRATLRPAQFVRNVIGTLALRLEGYVALLQSDELKSALTSTFVDDDPAAALERLVLSPLHQLRHPQPGPRYLLIDALDEALAVEQGPNLVEVLASCLGRWPDWLRVVATSRKDPEVLQQLRGLSARHVVADDPRNREDVSRFLAQRLDSLALASAVHASGKTAPELREMLLIASQGNFLFARTALEGVSQNKIGLLEAASLPPGLGSLYHLFFKRLYPQPRRDYAAARSLLQRIAAAREPMTRDELTSASGLGQATATAALRRLAPFVPPKNDPSRDVSFYTFFHKSLFDWLTGWDRQLDQPQAGAYSVDLSEAKRMLTDWCWTRYKRGPAKAPRYCLRNLTEHLAEAERWDRLRRLLLDFAWLQARLEAADVGALITDFSHLANDPELRLLQAAVRLSSHAVVRDKLQLAGQLTGRLDVADGRSVRRLLQGIIGGRQPTPFLRALTASLHRPGGALLCTLHVRARAATAVALSPDGTILVSGTSDGTTTVWDLQRAQAVRSFTRADSPVEWVGITADKRRVLTCQLDGWVGVWDADTGERLHSLDHLGVPMAAALMEDSTHAAFAFLDGRFVVLDLHTGRTCETPKDQGARTTLLGVCLGPTGQWGAQFRPDGRITVTTLDSFQTHGPYAIPQDATRVLAVLPGGLRVVCTSDDGKIDLWDLETGVSLARLSSGLRLSGPVALTLDGRRVVTEGDGLELVSIDLDDGGHVEPVGVQNMSMSAVAVTLDGHLAASASNDGTVKVWDLGRGRIQVTPRAHANRVNAAAVTHDGQWAVSTSPRGEIIVWEAKTGRVRGGIGEASDWIAAATLVPNTAWVATILCDGTFRLRDLQSGQVLHSWPGQDDWVLDVAVTQDGQTVCAGLANGLIKIWELKTGRLLRTMGGHESGIHSIRLGPDGRTVVSASADKTVKLWRLGDGQELRTLVGHAAAVNAAVFTPDAEGVVSASDDGTVRAWDLRTGAVTWIATAHEDKVCALALSADGDYVVSASIDRTLRVWHRATGLCLGAFMGESAMSCCAAASNHRVFVCGEESGRVHFLKLVRPGDPKAEGATARRRTGASANGQPGARSTASPHPSPAPRSPGRSSQTSSSAR